MKKTLNMTIAIIALLLVAFCGVASCIIREGLLRMKTVDTIVRIDMCVSSLLDENKTPSSENIISKMKHQFPDETYDGNQVLDAWKQPFQIYWQEDGDSFKITIRSAGRNDGDFSKNQGITKYQRGIRKEGHVEWERPYYDP
jgi:hypothetical protein